MGIKLQISVVGSNGYSNLATTNAQGFDSQVRRKFFFEIISVFTIILPSLAPRFLSLSALLSLSLYVYSVSDGNLWPIEN